MTMTNPPRPVSVSAAGQAITTYIRTHMQRCDAQQDHPLLLRHTLSGTPSDDDLLPALHSRSGGAHSTLNPENRATNFRRGTMVWYLSKATGAPCPFARAGIRLCEYGENGKVSSDPKERKRERRMESCGQKRKRSLRGCTNAESDSDSANDGKPPPKVKLTLRLRPCLSSPASSSSQSTSTPKDDIDPSEECDSMDCSRDSMSVDSSDEEEYENPSEPPWSLPPYPRRSISIPCYTPITDGPYPYLPQPPQNATLRRSPSIPYSIASPPPNSEEEDDDYHITMTDSCQCSTDQLRDHDTDLDWDLDMESDGEGDGETETQWESPGPRSPSAPVSNALAADIVVKQETKDIQGMLDAWDDFDCGVTDGKLLSRAAPGILDAESTSQIKVEALDHWDWPAAYLSASPDWSPPIFGMEDMPHIKQEESDPESFLVPPYPLPPLPAEHDSISPLSPLSTPSSSHSSADHLISSTSTATVRRHSELPWKDSDFEDQTNKFATVRARAQTSPSLTMEASTSISSTVQPRLSQSSPTATIRGRDPDSARPPTPTSSSFLASLIQSMNMSPIEHPQNDTISPSSLLISPTELVASHHDARNVYASTFVVVHTCQPCTPPVSATQVEGDFSSRYHISVGNLLTHLIIGISVYQMTLGSSPLLRRIDTDFVNISPIANYFSIPPPPTPNAMVISKGSAVVLGTWVPLASAQAFVREHPLPGGFLDIFLSDSLFERFPPALQDFHRSNAPGRLLNQFGPHFSSTTLEVQRHSQWPSRTDFPTVNWTQHQSQQWGREPVSEWDILDDLNVTPMNSVLARPAVNPFPMVLIPLDDDAAKLEETPLSATEQEMFHALCAIPDWEKENSPPTATTMTPRKATLVDEPTVVCEEAAIATSPVACVTSPPPADPPLRRSKRVANANANAVAAKTRASSRRRSARNSLN